MKSTALLTLAALILTACGGSTSVGIEVNPLPPTITEPCAHPSERLAVGVPWEIIAGRIGDDLIDCAAKHMIAVDAFDGVRDALAK